MVSGRAGLVASAGDAVAGSGCPHCARLRSEVQELRQSLTVSRGRERSWRSLHRRARAREDARKEEIRELRADISGAASLRRQVTRLQARLAAAGGQVRGTRASLQASVRALRERVRELEAERERLRAANRERSQLVFGRQSERRRAPASRGRGTGRPRGQVRGTRGHGRTRRPLLAVVEERVEPAARACPRCARPYRANGAAVTELVEVTVAAHVRRIRRRRWRACCGCAPVREAVAPAPARLFAHTAYGVSVWAWFLLECHASQRPLRSVARSLALAGVPVAAGTLADSQPRFLRLFAPVEQAIAARQRTARLAQGDETHWRVHARGERGDPARCWLWLCRTEDAVRMHIDPSRSARAAAVLFAEIGTPAAPAALVCDRFSAYRKLVREHPGQFVRSVCWVHARRDFVRIAQSHPALAAWAGRWVDRFAVLVRGNARRLEHWHEELPPAQQPAPFRRAQARLEQAVAAFFARAERELADPPRAAPAARALRALVREREGLTRFVAAPWIPMDNNACERLLRPPVIRRKVSFGSHSETGARLSAQLASVFGTLALADVNLRHWLLAYLGACADHGGRAPADLRPWLPWSMAPARLAALRRPGPAPPPPA